MKITRRSFLKHVAVASPAFPIFTIFWRNHLVSGAEKGSSTHLRGLVLVPENLTLQDWPKRAKEAGLNTISLHHAESPQALCDFVATDAGQTYLKQCRDAGI